MQTIHLSFCLLLANWLKICEPYYSSRLLLGSDGGAEVNRLMGDGELGQPNIVLKLYLVLVAIISSM